MGTSPSEKSGRWCFCVMRASSLLFLGLLLVINSVTQRGKLFRLKKLMVLHFLFAIA